LRQQSFWLFSFYPDAKIIILILKMVSYLLIRFQKITLVALDITKMLMVFAFIVLTKPAVRGRLLYVGTAHVASASIDRERAPAMEG